MAKHSGGQGSKKGFNYNWKEKRVVKKEIKQAVSGKFNHTKKVRVWKKRKERKH